MQLLYITTASRAEAVHLAHEIVKRNLAACANILPDMYSVFQWEGRVQHEHETVLLLKTADDRAEAARQAVAELHSYEVPCILQLPIQQGHQPFLDWVTAETRPQSS